MKDNLVQSRYFNKIMFNKKSNTIIKTSEDEQKLSNEILWYLKLPNELKKYTPKIIDYSLKKNNIFIELEYIPFLTLSQLLINKQDVDWVFILQKIKKIHEIFKGYVSKTELNSTCFYDMYIKKTRNRLSDYFKQSTIAQKTNEEGLISINNQIMKCPLQLLELNKEKIEKLSDISQLTLLHGDLCFSNIMLDPQSNKIKVIDPRGSFGEVGIFGDNRYDLAKIRHSLNGYEHIINDLFELRVKAHHIEYNILMEPSQVNILRLWDKENSDLLKEVKLIEALLFLSMIPLHRDYPNRQLIMYCHGTSLLNTIF
ncbi:hypothetical protein [Cytobacillus pseudoceanisediminis]|uniref:hypothetical protein n=1 Tax=Cytobacillus pseudoceanisediminis TaxID=3051614 RepID=UPI003C2F08FE